MKLLRAAALALPLLTLSCDDSPPAVCPPCAAPSRCDPATHVCVGFITPLWDAAPPDAGEPEGDAAP